MIQKGVNSWVTCAARFCTLTQPMNAPQNTRVIRFGPFEADLRTRELRKHGLKLKLQEQPFQVLAILLQHPGELVTREEICSSLWPEGTFIDFDHGLNTAVRRLRDALNDNADTPRFIETLPKRWYRFIGPVEKLCTEEATQDSTGVRGTATVTADGVTQPSPIGNDVVGNFGYLGHITEFEPLRDAAVPVLVDPSILPTGNPEQEIKGWQSKRTIVTRLLVLVVAMLGMVVAASMVRDHIRSKNVNQVVIKSIAVLPLRNLSGDPAQEYLADGITEELIGRLAGIHKLRVISRTSVMRFKNTQLSVPDIAKMLGVDAIVEGSIIREGNRIRVHAQLIRAATDDHFWSESYTRELHDVLALDADVAQAIASKIEVTITGDEHRRLAISRSVSPDVFEDYLKGRFALAKRNNKANIEESIMYFNEAIDKDPTYAPSYLGLGTAYWNLTLVFMGESPGPERPRVIQAARKALELDPELADAHVLIGATAAQQWRWAEAETEYHRALDLKPNDAAAYSELAWWLDCQGRTEEAVKARERARELDPLAVSGADQGFDLLFARHYDEAVHVLRSALVIKPDDAYAQWILGFVLIANHQLQQAISELETAVSASNRSPAVVGLLADAYAQAGRRRDALRLLEELKKRNQTGYVPPAAFVLAYLGLGDRDQAFVWLEQGYKEQSNVLQTLKVLPAFDRIRTDPRFVDLVRRVGLASP
jgi:TolB-like protein/DNA-binding winged helix-turn-helix (wHTH) protein